MPRARSGERRQEILETLAHMLHASPGKPVTTAALAREVGVSEAALYRHFPGKAQMFEALIVFIEETIFSRINRILAEESNAERQAYGILTLLLGFADKNPGITRLLQGDALVGETAYLRERVSQMFNRLETQLKQILREGKVAGTVHQPALESAHLLLAVAEGRIAQFVRSDFRDSPMVGWESQWNMLRSGIFSES